MSFVPQRKFDPNFNLQLCFMIFSDSFPECIYFYIDIEN